MLRRARRRAGLGQRDLAALVHESQSGISRWETGLRPLPPGTLGGLLELCGARLTQDGHLSPVLALDGEGLRRYRRLRPLARLQIAAEHLEAVGSPLGGLSWPRLRAVLRLLSTPADTRGWPAAGARDVVVTGAVARALHTPLLADHAEVGLLRVVAPAADAVHDLARRGRGLPVHITTGTVDDVWVVRVGSGQVPAWLAFVRVEDSAVDSAGAGSREGTRGQAPGRDDDRWARIP